MSSGTSHIDTKLKILKSFLSQGSKWPLLFKNIMQQ